MHGEVITICHANEREILSFKVLVSVQNTAHTTPDREEKQEIMKMKQNAFRVCAAACGVQICPNCRGRR